jgi:hypothetical protein
VSCFAGVLPTYRLEFAAPEASVAVAVGGRVVLSALRVVAIDGMKLFLQIISLRHDKYAGDHKGVEARTTGSAVAVGRMAQREEKQCVAMIRRK